MAMWFFGEFVPLKPHSYSRQCNWAYEDKKYDSLEMVNDQTFIIVVFCKRLNCFIKKKNYLVNKRFRNISITKSRI